MTYTRFGLMIVTSTLVMYILMYLNTYELDHILWSQTRGWMALMMGGVMAIIMLAFMWSMYPSRGANWNIVGASVVVAAGALWFVRSQATVDDASWMKAMIPHHSIAILTSSEAHIRDPRVRRLTDEIIEAQVQEIAKMRALMADLETTPLPEDVPDLPPLRAGEVPTREAVTAALTQPAGQ